MKFLIIFSTIMCSIAVATFVGLAQQPHSTEFNQQAYLEGRTNAWGDNIDLTSIESAKSPVVKAAKNWDQIHELGELNKEMNVLSKQRPSEQLRKELTILVHKYSALARQIGTPYWDEQADIAEAYLSF